MLIVVSMRTSNYPLSSILPKCFDVSICGSWALGNCVRGVIYVVFGEKTKASSTSSSLPYVGSSTSIGAHSWVGFSTSSCGSLEDASSPSSEYVAKRVPRPSPRVSWSRSCMSSKTSWASRWVSSSGSCVAREGLTSFVSYFSSYFLGLEVIILSHWVATSCFFLGFFGTGGCLFLNPRSHVVGGLLVVISTSLSRTTSTRVAAWGILSYFSSWVPSVELQQLLLSCPRHRSLAEELQHWSLMELEV